MSQDLKKFMMCVQKIPQLRNVFASCENLQETYDTFKIFLGDCSYEEYKNFFESFVKQNNVLSAEELESISGGVSNIGKRILTPVALFTIFSSTVVDPLAFANGPSTNFVPDGGSVQSMEIGSREQEPLLEEIIQSMQAKSETDQGTSDWKSAEETSPDNEAESEQGQVSKEDTETNQGTVADETSEDVKSEQGQVFGEDVKEKGDGTAVEQQDSEENESYDTTDAEVAYGLKYLEQLPKEGEAGFENYLKLPEREQLRSDRKEMLKENDGTTREVTLNEQEVYDQVKEKVNELIKKVEERTGTSKHSDRDKKLRVAKAIYRWIAKNITYDRDDCSAIKTKHDDLLKPQDALFVYHMKIGVCSGYARLAELMLRMADIPSIDVGTIHGKDVDWGHAFNAVYINDKASGQIGWTLIDATWAAPHSDKDTLTGGMSEEEREKSKEKELLEGIMYCYFEMLKFRLDLDKQYADELNSLWEQSGGTSKLNASSSKEEILKVLSGINEYINQQLLEINKKHNCGIKLEKIEIEPMDGISDKELLDASSSLSERFIIKYKTNLDQEQARTQAIRLLQKEQTDPVIYQIDVFNAVNFDAQSVLYACNNNLVKVNIAKNPALQSRVSSYIEEVNQICQVAFAHYNNDARSNVEQINNEIQSNLEVLNNQYKDIIVFESINFEYTQNENMMLVNTKNTLTPEEAMPLMAKLKEATQETNKEYDSFHIYFPAFYTPGRTLAENNESILRHQFHRVGRLFHSIKINGVTYILYGQETKAYIEIDGPFGEPIVDFRIPEELSRFEIPFAIRLYIESLILTGNERIDFSNTLNLRKLDISHSTRYFVKDGKLYERKKSGKAVQVDIPNTLEIATSQGTEKILCDSPRYFRKDGKFYERKENGEIVQLNTVGINTQ